MKVVINKCYGGFFLSKDAEAELRAGGWIDSDFADIDERRADPTVVEVVERLGLNANGRHSNLKIVEIPDGTDFEIGDYDGMEWVAEKHRCWS